MNPRLFGYPLLFRERVCGTHGFLLCWRGAGENGLLSGPQTLKLVPETLSWRHCPAASLHRAGEGSDSPPLRWFPPPAAMEETYPVSNWDSLSAYSLQHEGSLSLPA